MKKVTRKPSADMMKICNNCGEIVIKYSIIDNGIFCEDCFPTVKESKKKIPNEKNMIKKLMEYNKK
jgi:formylmethanofuran dehydrogenase subunit E